jgi:hypothetical protein
MTTLKSLTIVAALLVSGTSLAMAQNGPATGGHPPVAGGAGGYLGYGYGNGYAAAPLYDAAPVADLAQAGYGRLWLCSTGPGRNDHYYRDASSGPQSAVDVRGTASLHSTACDYRLLRCGFSADICLRARKWV